MKHQEFKRSKLIEKIRDTSAWDVIVIGGGASGLGVALDALSRGFKTILLEQVDFAKGTSSKATKLVHGGVRYLAQGDISLVKEALHERGLLQKNAPHLVKNQSFIIPNYSWFDGPFYTIGMKIYDLLAGKLSLGKSTHINKEETLSRISTVRPKGLYGGVVYQDGQFDDSRLALNIAQTCIQMGGVALNYVRVNSLTKDSNGRINGVIANDTETGEVFTIQGKAIINATGIFVDDILKMDRPEAKQLVRPSQGVHLVFDKSFLPGDDAIMIPKTDDGRVLFLVPWHNRVIAGTTDTPIDEHSLEPVALEQEIDFILKTAGRYLTKQPTRADALAVFAGLRPLAAPTGNSNKTKEISRSHKVIVSDSKLLTLTGGKWTTFRRMGQDTIDKAIKIGCLPQKESRSATQKIYSAIPTSDRSNHLYIYGADQEAIHALAQENPEWNEKLIAHLEFKKAEVVWAARNELARTVEDVLSRRVRMLFLDAKAAIEAAPEVARLLAQELDKDENWQNHQIENFQKVAKNYILK
ncbi:MAG: glycerol-3-phosphate dehydrogenase/oxidase [Sphingobacterium sp.]|jgi:glycerol-3-phosphate dehydrogenase|uniref:glycerol-3-phosphate dehydrogenase/oxidase n=1 Tax=unclassified Sphingobacterium TaxID=2609468 RepID=UPI00284D9DAE|nr:glycerol-3-phosphate dehydrogenase/oxidase [Sphingobacterium sp.]MDR3007767.1 glycerol-3-phosphate dehydrogenase/oxidase [Sphingobacterium sp.]